MAAQELILMAFDSNHDLKMYFKMIENTFLDFYTPQNKSFQVSLLFWTSKKTRI